MRNLGPGLKNCPDKFLVSFCANNLAAKKDAQHYWTDAFD